MTTRTGNAERRVRELLAKGWKRKSIVVRVAEEIRRKRNNDNPYDPADTEGYAE